jgi:hypothetical protein
MARSPFQLKGRTNHRRIGCCDLWLSLMWLRSDACHSAQTRQRSRLHKCLTAAVSRCANLTAKALSQLKGRTNHRRIRRCNLRMSLVLSCKRRVLFSAIKTRSSPSQLLNGSRFTLSQSDRQNSHSTQSRNESATNRRLVHCSSCTLNFESLGNTASNSQTTEPET